MLVTGRVLGTEVGSTAPFFLAILAVHVPAGLVAVLSGAGAALSRKGSARHVRFGRYYCVAIGVVFVTAGALAGLRWREDWYLFLLGALAFAAAMLGYLHRRRHRAGDTAHILGMGGSYAVMLTAFYVDNGPHLPLWDRLPHLAFWLLPGAIAAPLILRAVRRARRDHKPTPGPSPDATAARVR
ncbi:MAG TPA: hypothetical protein VFU74_04695 [Actinocrinis sp.]|nr:hypothetical protein [Actinocrinis sp.]